MPELTETRPKRGRPRINPERPLTNAEYVARWRAKHPKPPKPPAEEPEFPWLRGAAELAGGGLLPDPGTEQQQSSPHGEHSDMSPKRLAFDAEALIGPSVFFPDASWRWY
jgi:hypothetical protein